MKKFHTSNKPILRDALFAAAPGFGGVLLLSAMLNLLALTGSLYLLLIYDRVLPSGSVETLVSLAIIVTFLYAFSTAFDAMRLRLLNAIANVFDRRLAPLVQDIEMQQALDQRVGVAPQFPMRDLAHIRNFLTSGGPAAFVDLPWVVLFILVLALLHWALGLTAFLAVLALSGWTLHVEHVHQHRIGQVGEAARQEADAASSLRNWIETIRGLGIAARFADRVLALHQYHVSHQRDLADQSAVLGAVSRGGRMYVQAMVLTVGALLVIEGRASGGIIFAGSILAARALAPIDSAIANWRGFTAARQAWFRLDARFKNHAPSTCPSVGLPRPQHTLAVEHVAVAPPGAARLTLLDANFTLNAGEALALVGPSGAGKSSLVKVLVNAWSQRRGAIRLDGADYRKWDPDELGACIGYLSQHVDLFLGTIAQNIARFDENAASQEVIETATMCGLHEQILKLPEGYDTDIGEHGRHLSGGLRQRIGLARALFRNPFLVVLDEPNSSLDSDGEKALITAIDAVRRRGSIVIVATHHIALLGMVDKVLVLCGGQQQIFGTRDRVLGQRSEDQPRQSSRARAGE